MIANAQVLKIIANKLFCINSSFCFCWVKQLSIQNSDDFWLWSNFSTLRRLQKINLIHWAGWLNVGQPSFWLHFIPNTHTSAEVSLAKIHSQMSWPFTRPSLSKISTDTEYRNHESYTKVYIAYVFLDAIWLTLISFVKIPPSTWILNNLIDLEKSFKNVVCNWLCEFIIWELHFYDLEGNKKNKSKL